jgi:hypothetical protein
VKLWKQNPDGGGIAYPDGERIVVEKAMHFAEFWKQYRRALKATGGRTPILIHMRIATHGEIDLANTHPFRVDDFTVMAHNGVLHDCAPNKWEQRSDTRVFVEDFLPKLPSNWLDDEHLSLMVDAFVSGNRLMFLSVDPNLKAEVYRFGRWENYKGLHLSNTYGLFDDKFKSKAFKFRTAWDWQKLDDDGNWVPTKVKDDATWLAEDDDEDELDELEAMRREYDYDLAWWEAEAEREQRMTMAEADKLSSLDR